MNISEIIQEWRKGCSCTIDFTTGKHEYPGGCPECTDAAIRAIEKQAAGLQARCESLAAEVHAVRFASYEVYSAGYNHGHLDTANGIEYADDATLRSRSFEVLEQFIDPSASGSTSDEVLAQVRAHGVEMLAEHLNCPDMDTTIRDFAEHLRKGAM